MKGLAQASRARPAQDSAADGAAAKKQLEQELNRLSTSIDKFRIDGQRFFGGDLPQPPDELGERVQAEFRRLRVSPNLGAAESFRLNALEAKFNSHLELLGRRLRQREQGTAVRTEKVAAAPDPERGIVIGPAAPANAIEVLYKGLYMRPGEGAPTMDLDRFRTYVHRQAEMIRGKTGCSDIEFRVAVEEGKMKLKAKPISRGA